MKKVKVTKYICSYCGKEFMDEDKCIACEEFHDKVKRILPYEDGDYDVSSKRSGALAQPKVVTVEMASGAKAVYKFDHIIENVEEEPLNNESSDAGQEVNNDNPEESSSESESASFAETEGEGAEADEKPEEGPSGDFFNNSNRWFG